MSVDPVCCELAQGSADRLDLAGTVIAIGPLADDWPGVAAQVRAATGLDLAFAPPMEGPPRADRLTGLLEDVLDALFVPVGYQWSIRERLVVASPIDPLRWRWQRAALPSRPAQTAGLASMLRDTDARARTRLGKGESVLLTELGEGAQARALGLVVDFWKGTSRANVYLEHASQCTLALHPALVALLKGPAGEREAVRLDGNDHRPGGARTLDSEGGHLK